MSVRNPHHRMTKKEVFWQHHLDCWAITTQNQASYCAQNNLSTSDFSKWKKRLNPKIKNISKKRPLAVEHKEFARNTLLKQKSKSCSYCGKAERQVNKLFYGRDDLVAICDQCLWHKANQLHLEIPSYKTVRFEKCSVCLKDKPGVLIGNIYYHICTDCLIDAWSDQFTSHPETHPCRNRCVVCDTKDPKEFMGLGIHIICQTCLTTILKKYISFSIDVDKCSFCQTEKSQANPLYDGNVALYGKSTRWICESCAEQAVSSFKEIDQANINHPRCCSICGAEKQKGIPFVEGVSGQICQSCVNECHSLLNESSDDSD